MAQLAQGLGFDLADTLAGDRERLADLFERMLGAVFQTKPHLDYFLFARSQRPEDLCGLVFQVHVDHGFGRRNHGPVFDEVAQMRIFFFTDRRLQRDRLLSDLEHLAHLGHRNIHALGDLFRGRLTPQLLDQLPRGADQLVDGLDHVHRNADGAGLIGNGAGDGLANPPRCVRGELVAAAVLELVHGFHQADIAFLDQIQELQPAVGVFLGDRYHQAQVRFNQLALGGLGIHVSLDNLALRPLQLRVADAGFGLQRLQVGAVRALDTAEFLLGILAPSGLDLLFQVVDVAIKRPHGVNRLVHAIDQALALWIGELQVADAAGHHDLGPAQVPAIAAVLFRPLLLDDPGQPLFELLDLFVVLADIIDLAHESFQPGLHDLVGNFLFVKRHQLLDGAHAFTEILAQGQDLFDDDR